MVKDSNGADSDKKGDDLRDFEEAVKTNDFDVENMMNNKRRIEESGQKDYLHFMGETFVYKKNPWKGTIFPRKSERIWSRLPRKVERKPTENQIALAKLLKWINANPQMKYKTGQERIQIRRLVKERIFAMEANAITKDSVERTIDECVRSIGKNGS